MNTSFLKKRIPLIMICMTVLPSVNGQIMPEREQVTPALSWEQFMSRQNLVWTVLPTELQEAPFLGNGKLGLQICQDSTDRSLLFYTGSTEVRDSSMEGRLLGSQVLPTGHFKLQTRGQILDGKITLDLWHAEAITELKTTEGSIRITSLVHADEQIIINRCESSGNETPVHWQWIGSSHNKKNPQDLLKTECHLYPEGGIYKIHHKEGDETAVLWHEKKTATSQDLYMTINHAYPDASAIESGKNALRSILRKGYRRTRQSHQNWWHDFYQKSFVSLPNDTLENFYWAQIYQMGSSIREDGSTLVQKKGYLQSDWWPDDQWNIGVQSVYMPLNRSNHVEMSQVLEDAFYNPFEDTDSLSKSRRRLWMKGGRKQSKAANEALSLYDIEPSQWLWTCQNLWMIYRHKMDDRLLREKLYPLLKTAVNRYLPYLQQEPNGSWYLTAMKETRMPGQSGNAALPLLHWGCQTLLSAARRLQIQDPQIATWQKTLRNLTPQLTEEEQLMPDHNETAFPVNLLCVYPCYTLNVDQEKNRHKITEAVAEWIRKEHQKPDFSYGLAASYLTAVRQPDEALTCLRAMLHLQTAANTMMRDQQQTPNLTGMQSIYNMLLQSWEEKIRVFPAVPSSWKDIAFYHLRCEGGFLVSAARRNGQTAFIEVTNTMGELCTLEIDFDNPVFETSRKIRITRTGNRVYHIPVRKGETVRVYPQGHRPDLTIRPVANGNGNVYGQKK